MRFEYHLARELRMTVSEMRRRMSTAEFAGWSAFYRWEAEERERQQEKQRRKRR